MKQPACIALVLSSIYSPSGSILLRQDDGRQYLQIEGNYGRGRKWWLSEHMTRSEVVRTAFMASLAYEEHELRESFTYRGVRVFGPHLDVEALVEIANREDRRREAPGAWECEDSDEIEEARRLINGSVEARRAPLKERLGRGDQQ